MKLHEIFLKPIDRPIEGVIKADDESSLRNEVEEYVLTNEVSKRLEEFLEAYNNYQGANGAWLSGFFGSGKSHLLKMLALLLENRTIDGISVLDVFLEKADGNEMLKASLRKAVSIPSKSILFNIDQKADVIAKSQIDALVSVFVKVFDDLCGYYGKQGYVAKFERDLDQRGLYAAFKERFEKISGKPWEKGREQELLYADHIAQAYAQITGTSVESVNGILDKYRETYKVSIEDFALQVNAYIEAKGGNFHLNFFVDEVGQFIADNTKLMTNLQTIAESLGTKCRGRSWIVVTAQDDMEQVIGELNEKRENDFSKIMARFATRLKLTSKNVDEVIQKRLLLKNSSGVVHLDSIYQQQVNNFGTLFDFSDGATTYRNFRDKRNFIDSYPFVSYQFQLFQSAIKSLSEHNAFEGRHRSVGERSMLGVFQHVSVAISSNEVGQLATFDRMFEGIRTALKGQFQSSILIAENHLGNSFAVQVLKALFLVKYIKGFKATPHNITVLMIDRFGVDLLQLRRQVEEALNLLEQQSYIQRNGDVYEYLTDEEKDVEKEIKNTEVDSDAVTNELGKIIFDQIIRDRKISDDNKQDFPYTRKLDGHLQGRESETAIHVITPFHEHFDNEETLRMQSMGRDELLIILPADNYLVTDTLMYKRTEKYIQQNLTAAQQESIRRILTEKSLQNRERARQLELKIKTLISTAKMFIGGTEIEITGTDPLTRIVKGFQELIRRTYPNLKMLHGITYSENDIESYLHQNVNGLLGNDPNQLTEAEQEMLAFIQNNKNNGLRTSMKILSERFERKPYGWPLAAVQCNLALLSNHSKVVMSTDGNQLENSALVKALKNTAAHSNLILEPQVEFTASQVRRLKDFFEDFFDKPPQSSEARDLGKETATALADRVATLALHLNNRTLYPFLAQLVEPVNLLKEFIGKPYTFYLVELPKQMDALLNQKETTIAPILSFMNGPSKGLFDEVRQFIQSQSDNFDYLQGEDASQLREVITDPAVYRGNRLQQARALMDRIQRQLSEQLAKEKRHAADGITTARQRLFEMKESGFLSPQQKEQLGRPFEKALERIAEQNLIAKVRDIHRTFEDVEYPKLLTQILTMAQHTPANGVSETNGGEKRPAPPAVEIIQRQALTIDYNKPLLASEQDITEYLDALRSALLAEINQGKRVKI